MSIFYTAYFQSDFFGKCIILALFALSIICWVVLLYKMWQTRRIRQVSHTFQKAFEKNKERLLGLEIDHLPRCAYRDVPHPFAQIFFSLKEKTIEILNKNHFFLSQEGVEPKGVYLSASDLDLVESHTLTTISIQSKQLEKNLFILSTIVTLAPFMGLLGTVWGILATFSELHKGASMTSNTLILGGLATALATTVLGLVIAIPALVAYNYLKNTTKNLSSEMEDFLYVLLSQLELQYRKADIS